MVKQYTLDPAYTGNSIISWYEDGKCVRSTVVAEHYLPGYLDVLEKEGYVRAYNEAFYLAKFQEAKEEYEMAQAMLDLARKHALIVPKE